jgi:hypothetical protein
LVRRLETEARCAGGIALDADLDHYQQAALHRRVLESALVQHGYLSITRRPIPQQLFGRKVAMIIFPFRLSTSGSTRTTRSAPAIPGAGRATPELHQSYGRQARVDVLTIDPATDPELIR